MFAQLADVRSLGDEPSNHAIHIFIASSLPGTVWMRIVDDCPGLVQDSASSNLIPQPLDEFKPSKIEKNKLHMG